MTQFFLHNLQSHKKQPPRIGRKGEYLHMLQQSAWRTPATYALSWDAYELWQRDPVAAVEVVGRQLSETLEESQRYAVRSSANVEDGAEHSFAGQFASVLDVSGVKNLVRAVERVWASAHDPRVQPYLQAVDKRQTDVKMAVIIQEMVPPHISGVSFSRNPLTSMDEVVVEAVAGSGEALVQEGATPERWIHKWGAWLQRPQESIAQEALMAQIVGETRELEAHFGQPVDLEWVTDGQQVYWVQARPISTGKQVDIYSNRIAREVLPGVIKPLVWSVNVPLVNSAWVRLFSELIGPNDIKPEALSKAFYYRAYFNMGTIGRIFEALGMPRETLELLMGFEGGAERPRFRPSGKTFGHLPRMARFAMRKLRYGREIETFLPRMDQTYRRFAQQDVAQLDEKALLREIDALIAFTVDAAYVNIVGPLLMSAYNNLLYRQLAKRGIDYRHLDLMAGIVEMADYDPGVHLTALQGTFAALDAASQARVRQASLQELTTIPEAAELHAGVAAFVERFGHLSDSGNDFSARPWREAPELVLRMVLEEQTQAADGSANEEPVGLESSVTWEDLELGRGARWRLGWLYRRARQFRLYREAISFRYTYGYGLLRNYFMALGERLVQRSLLNKPGDIFMLYLDEVRRIVDGKAEGVSWQDVVDQRRTELEAAANVVLPEIIYGDRPPPLQQAWDEQEQMQGIASSGGYYEGRVRVVRSVEEFDRMVPGAVLVIPYSDVSWTPLFRQAGAVIAEAGGILSHSSIVAREYGLPGVVSVNGACSLLQDNMRVLVDGYTGTVTISDRAPASGKPK